MSKIIKAAITDDSVGTSAIKLENNSYLRARNAADNADVNVIKLNASNAIEFAFLPIYSGSSFATQGYVTTALASYQATSEKGAANGYASLDGSGRVPAGQLPLDATEYQGSWDASMNDPVLADGVGDTGDFYIVTVAGSQDLGSGSQSFAVGDWAFYDGAIWEKVSNSNSVASVNSQTGVVVLDTDDIAEGSTNLYYTAARFNTAFGGKSTSDLSEGTNLYFTNARAIASTLTGYTSGAGTISSSDTILQAIQKLNGNIAGKLTDYYYRTLDSTDITNQYIDLPVTSTKVVAVDVKGYPVQWLTDDYTVSLSGGGSSHTRVSFAGDMAGLVSGNKVKVTYNI